MSPTFWADYTISTPGYSFRKGQAFVFPIRDRVERDIKKRLHIEFDPNTAILLNQFPSRRLAQRFERLLHQPI